MRALAAATAFFLATPALFGFADLRVTWIASTGTPVRAGELHTVMFAIRNAGPDTAQNVVLTMNATGGISTGLCATGCSTPNILPGENRPFSVELLFPTTPGDVILTATARTSDPSEGTKSATMIVAVSPDPDLVLGLSAPIDAHRALPFPLSIKLINESAIVAHDVDVTVDFRPDVGVGPLPSGCSNPAAGRIVCHADSVAKTTSLQELFVVTLVGPPDYGSGDISFTGSAVEREHDYDASSNTARGSTALYVTFYVTTTADSGAGSLRQAILDANAGSALGGPVEIAFKIAEASPTPWKTIRVTSPLPTLDGFFIRVDGGMQTAFFGKSNPDGPDIEISGGGQVDGDGITITNCVSEIANLAINSFRHNGLSIIDSTHPLNCTPYVVTEVHDLFLGTDPTGSEARPNGQRGIGVAMPNGTNFNTATQAVNIHDNVVSGNTMSGIFALSGRVILGGNRIGVKAHSDDPLPNGASGIFIGPGGYGSAIGNDSQTATPNRPGNVIAFNRETGVAIATGVNDVSVRGNRIWSNGLLGIDVGLDGPSNAGPVGAPTLTLAHYDPLSNKTIIEGDTPDSSHNLVDLYASDVTDPSGFGEGQRPIGTTLATQFTSSAHFRFEADGNLTGQFITATCTRVNPAFLFAKPEGINLNSLTQTSEFSRAIEVR